MLEIRKQEVKVTWILFWALIFPALLGLLGMFIYLAVGVPK